MTDSVLRPPPHRRPKTYSLSGDHESAESDSDRQVTPDHGIIFRSRQMAEVMEIVGKAARGNANILILGESGTGKELIARAIHALSPCAEGPFLGVNLSALPETLMESELFGHVKGSFTGATGDRDGHFIAANGGSLFLDEIGEVPPHVQVKLLRVIEMREVMRVGSSTNASFDTRLIFATNRDLVNHHGDSTFRSDLFYRISTILIRVPPLREREGDLPLLIEVFLRKFSREACLPLPPALSYDALRALCTYDWPGNIRELQNVVERLVALHGENGEVGLTEVEAALNSGMRVRELDDVGSFTDLGGGHSTSNEYPYRADWVQYMHHMKVLELAGGISHAAKKLGIDRRTFQRRLKVWRAYGWVQES